MTGTPAAWALWRRLSISRRVSMQPPQWMTRRYSVEVLGIIPARRDVDLQLAADVLAEPPGDLDPPDVVLEGVVGAGLGDEHPVPRPQGLDHRGPGRGRGEIPLLPGEEDREGRAGDLLRDIGGDLQDRLGVADGDVGLPVEKGEGGWRARAP